jgi:TPR repeat protein
MKIFILLLGFSLSAYAQEEESEALQALRLSCQQNVGLGCYNYANMLLKRNQSDQADKYFVMGCKLDHSDSCIKKTWEHLSNTATKSEETTYSKSPSPAPASVDETHDVPSEDQSIGEASGENPSLDETDLDLSAIE